MGCHASGDICVISRSCIPRAADWSVGITFNHEKQAEQVSITCAGVDSQIRHRLATQNLFGSPAGFNYLARHTNVHQASEPDEQAVQFESQLAVYNHELRNFISSVNSWTRYLKAGRKDPNGEVLAEGLRAIERNSEVLEQLTQDGPVVGCSFSKTPTSQDSLELNQPLTDCIDDCRAIAKASSIAISQRRTDAPLWIRGDRFMIHQLLTNLLLNSIKYGFPGALVRVVSKFQESHLRHWWLVQPGRWSHDASGGLS